MANFPSYCSDIKKWVLSYFNSPDSCINEIPINMIFKSDAFRYLICNQYWDEVKNNTIVKIENLPEENTKMIWNQVLQESKGTLNHHQCYSASICLYYFDCIL